MAAEPQPRRGLLLALESRGPDGPQIFVDRDELTVGRAPGNDLPVPTASVSKRHLAIVRRADGWYVVDTHSTSGTIVNGQRIRGEQRLAPGDRIWFSQEVLRVEALDHLAAPGEFPIDHSLRLRGRGFACSVDLELRSTAPSLDAERQLYARIVRDALGAVTHSSARTTLEVSDPVGALHHAADLVAIEQLGGVAIRGKLVRAAMGAAAIELLADPSEPARVAWTWLWARVGLPPLVAVPSLVGAAAGRWNTSDAPPAELVAAAAAGPGGLVWITHEGIGQLHRLEGTTRVGGGGPIALHDPAVTFVLARAGTGWTLEVRDTRARPLELGVPLRLSVVLPLWGTTVTLVATD